MTPALAALLMVAAVVLAALSAHRRAAASRHARGGRRRAVTGDVWLAALGHLRRMLPWLVGMFSGRDARTAIQRSGLDGRITARDVAAARAACVLAAAMLTPRLAQTLPLRMLPILVPLLLWAAAELPMYLLARRARRRGDALRASLPDALDLLRAALAAGLSLRRSLSLVADHSADPVAGEFACVAAETALGISQSTALDGLAARNPEPEVRALVSAIRQAERNGSPLAPVIAAQARDARLAHNRAIIERGARAGPKIQLVVSATIVPGALIGLGAIVIAAIARGDLKIL